MSDPRTIVARVVSGGQTGVDRAALDVAIELEIPHGGWCPLGRLAEDGPIPDRYNLRETRSRNYAVRTVQNVVDADATLIIYRGRLTGGTLLTHRLAVEHQRPHCLVNLDESKDAAVVRAWLEDHAVAILNVAGPRESSLPGIAAAASEFLLQVFA